MMGRFSSSSYQRNPSVSTLLSAENDPVLDYNDPYLSSSSSVDCTLSLGTPSTRLYEDDHDNKRRFSSASTNMSSLGWDFFHGNGKTASYVSQPHSDIGRGGDPLLARRCANCDTTSTPLWRNGPRGPKSLCNACGIRFKKEERRATAGNASSGAGPSAAGVPEDHHYHGVASYHHHHHHASSTWVHQQYHAQTQRVPCYSPAANEYRFGDDVRDDDSDVTAMSFLSWRLNVADRPSLVHDCTR